MEEWVPPTSEPNAPRDTPPPPPPPPPLPPPHPLPLPPRLRHETYIVQVPKEQIYRVPPPENAFLAEQYKTIHEKNRASPCMTYLPWIIGILLVVAVIVGAIVLVIYLLVKPQVPSFSIQEIVAKNLNHTNRWKKPEYDIVLRTRNPSAKMGYSYERGGKAVMSHNGGEEVVASGEPPELFQGPGSETRIKLVLRGSSKTLPEAIEKSFKGLKKTIRLSLLVDYAVRQKIGLIKMAKSLSIECHFRASSLAKRTRVVSQQCNAKVR